MNENVSYLTVKTGTLAFLDVCNRCYELLAEAARATHERLYQVGAGDLEPYDDPPVYLARPFL